MYSEPAYVISRSCVDLCLSNSRLKNTCCVNPCTVNNGCAKWATPWTTIHGYPCFYQVKSRLETFNSLCTAYGNAMMPQAMVYHWYEAFEKGRASASLKGGLGTPCRAVTEVIVNTAAAII